MEPTTVITVLAPVVAGGTYAAVRRGGEERERTRRTRYRAVVVVILSAFRVRTIDIERRLRAISDDGPSNT